MSIWADDNMEKQNKIERISSLLDSGSSAAKSGIVSGAKYLSKSIEKGGDYIIHNTVAHEKPADVRYLEQIEKLVKPHRMLLRVLLRYLEKLLIRLLTLLKKNGTLCHSQNSRKNCLKIRNFRRESQ